MSLLKRIEQGQGGEPQGPPEGEGESRLTSIRTRRMPPPGVSPQRETYLDLKTRVQNRLLAELDPLMDVSRVGDVRRAIQDLFEQILAE
jgi:pilus assembly protein CpaF